MTSPPGPGSSGQPGVRGVRIVGAGRAGRSLAAALSTCGWDVTDVLDRSTVEAGGDAIRSAASGVDVVVLAVPDDALAGVAAAVEPGAAAIVHLSGSTGLDVLHPHRRVGSVHPLVSLPDPDIGARRLLAGATFAVAGDDMAGVLVAALGGRAVTVADENRGAYHAAASVAANHLVVLAAQVERLAGAAGVPIDAYWELMATTLDTVRALGPAQALTGPAARGDVRTIAGHLAAIDPGERTLYLTLADEAALLAGRPRPSEVVGGDRNGPAAS